MGSCPDTDIDPIFPLRERPFLKHQSNFASAILSEISGNAPRRQNLNFLGN